MSSDKDSVWAYPKNGHKEGYVMELFEDGSIKWYEKTNIGDLQDIIKELTRSFINQRNILDKFYKESASIMRNKN